MNTYPVMPGVPAAGHVAGGFWHPGRAETCEKGLCGYDKERERLRKQREADELTERRKRREGRT